MNESGLTVGEIAELCGAERPGESDGLILRVSAAARADEHCVVFAEDEAALRAALASRAAAILTGKTVSAAGDKRMLRVVDPRYAFALCAKRLRTAEGEPGIHPAAWVDPTATLGARVRVGAGAVIGAGARLGNDVVIGRNAVVEDGVVIGDRVEVQSGVVLGSIGFGYVRDAGTGEYLRFPQQGDLVIEDDVEIGANSTIDRGALEETRIGRGTKIDNQVHIGHNCRIGKNVILAAHAGLSGSCVLDDGAIMAGQSGMSEHCHLGPGVILGGGSGVYRGKTLMGPGEVYAGTPAEPLRDHLRALARLRRLR